MESATTSFPGPDVADLITARNADLDILKEEFPGAFDADNYALGPAVEPSPHGRLGALWHRDQDHWFTKGSEAWHARLGRDIELNIIRGEDFKGSQEAVLHFVVWGPVETAKVAEVTRQIKSVRDTLLEERKGKPLPGFFVYAPGIGEDLRRKLEKAGALVEADSRQAWRPRRCGRDRHAGAGCLCGTGGAMTRACRSPMPAPG